MCVCVYFYILKCSIESRDTVLNTWEVELYRVLAKNGKVNYGFIPASLCDGYPLMSEQPRNTKRACRDEIII